MAKPALPTTMRQARLYAPGDLRIDELAIGPLVDDEVLVRNRCAAIVGTDLKFYTGEITPGSYPSGVGGSSVGEVVATGPVVENFRLGDRVIARGPAGCGKCPRCQRGQGNYCFQRSRPMRRRGSAFAEYTVLPEFSLVRAPAKLTDEQAALLNPVMLAIHVHSAASYGAGDRVVVVGAGPVGWGQIRYAQLQGARCLALEPRPGRRRLAVAAGAEAALDPFQAGSLGEVQAWCDGVVEWVIDCVATQAAQEMIFDLVAPGGTVALTGTSGWTLPIQWIVHRSLRVCGFRGGIDMEQAADLIASGEIDLTPMVSHRVGLDDLPAAYRLFTDGQTEHFATLLVLERLGVRS